MPHVQPVLGLILLMVAWMCGPLPHGEAQESWRTITPDVVYGHKVGMALTYDVIQPTENSNGAGVLFIFSGGWVSQHVPPEQLVRPQPGNPLNFWESLVKRGYTLYIVRHGSSPLFKVPDAVADVQRAISHIRMQAKEQQVDPNRLGVSGWSAGGHLSLMLGTTGRDEDPQATDELERAGSRVRAVAAYFPPTDLAPFVREDSSYPQNFPALVFPKDKVASVSPLQQVSADDAPTLLVHGDQDELVPLRESEQMAEALEEAGVPNRLLVMPGAGHGFTGQQEQKAREAVLQWFEKYLLETDG